MLTEAQCSNYNDTETPDEPAEPRGSATAANDTASEQPLATEQQELAAVHSGHPASTQNLSNSVAGRIVFF